MKLLSKRVFLILVLFSLIAAVVYWMVTFRAQKPSSPKPTSRPTAIYTPEEKARLKDTSLPEPVRAIVPRLESEEIIGKIEKIEADKLTINTKTYSLSPKANFALIKGGNSSMSKEEISKKEEYVLKSELKVGDNVKATYVSNLDPPGLLFIKIFRP